MARTVVGAVVEVDGDIDRIAGEVRSDLPSEGQREGALGLASVEEGQMVASGSSGGTASGLGAGSGDRESAGTGAQ